MCFIGKIKKNIKLVYVIIVCLSKITSEGNLLNLLWRVNPKYFHVPESRSHGPITSPAVCSCLARGSPQYGIVLDAGSSHTALYIYKWPADKQNGTGVVTQHGECHANGECRRSLQPMQTGQTS